MKKTFWTSILTITLLAGPISGFAQDDDEATFPVEAATTELTEEERKQATENFEKARELYTDILAYDSEGKADTLMKNLDYLEGRIAKTEKELARCKDDLKKLNGIVATRYREVVALGLSEGETKRRKIELAEQFQENKEYLEYRIKTLAARLDTLVTRERDMKAQLKALNADGAVRAKPVNPLETQAGEAETMLDNVIDTEKANRADDM